MDEFVSGHAYEQQLEFRIQKKLIWIHKQKRRNTHKVENDCQIDILR